MEKKNFFPHMNVNIVGEMWDTIVYYPGEREVNEVTELDFFHIPRGREDKVIQNGKILVLQKTLVETSIWEANVSSDRRFDMYGMSLAFTHGGDFVASDNKSNIADRNNFKANSSLLLRIIDRHLFTISVSSIPDPFIFNNATIILENVPPFLYRKTGTITFEGHTHFAVSMYTRNFKLSNPLGVKLILHGWETLG